MVEESWEVISIRFLCKSSGDWAWLISDKVLKGTSSDVMVEESWEVISIWFLCKSGGDWAWLICDKVLECTSGDVMVEEGWEVISIWFLCKSSGDWWWLICDQVLKSSSSNVMVEKSWEVITVGFLCESSSDWAWLVGNKVLEGTSGDVMVEEGWEVITIWFHVHVLELNKSLGDWCIGISDEVNKCALGNVLTVEFTNKSLSSWLSCSLAPVWSHIIGGIISIIIWETFIEGLGESLWSIKWVSEWWCGDCFWNSLDHHGDGDVIVIRDVFLLISILLEDGVEGVVTNNLSETFEGNRFDVIVNPCWWYLEGNSSDLINWDINGLGLSFKSSWVLGGGWDKALWCWSNLDHWGLGNSSLNISMTFWVMVMFLMVLFLVVL